MGLLYSAKVIHEWLEFVEGLRLRNRYVPADARYIDTLLEGLRQRVTTLAIGTSLFRSRIMPLERSREDRPLTPEEMGPPPPQVATGGRLNPDGISCLYAALEEDTAVCEVRPWTGARLTVAQFRTVKPLELVDLTAEFDQKSDQSDQRFRLLSALIAMPVHREDRWGYLGTQFLAEALKAEGVAGMLYRSSMRAEGRNLALFSTLDLQVGETKLVTIRSVAYSYGPPLASR